MRMLFTQYKNFRTLFSTLKRIPYGSPWSLEDFALNVRNTLRLTSSLPNDIRIQAFIEFYLYSLEVQLPFFLHRVYVGRGVSKKVVRKTHLVRCFKVILKDLELGKL